MSCDYCKKQSIQVLREHNADAVIDVVFATGGAAAPNTCPDCGNFSENGDLCRSCKLAEQLSQRKNGATTSFTQVKGSLQRCRSCGRFASMDKAHVCPVTSSPQDLARALNRRIGGDASQLYGEQRIADLFDEAAQSDNNTVYMLHPFSFMSQEVELDAVPVLMQAGYLPGAWIDETKYRVLGKNGRVYEVCDVDDKLPSAPIADNPIMEAAQAYGLDVPTDTPVMSAAPAEAEFAGAYFAQYSVVSPATLALGGEAWDARKVSRREFGSRSPQGNPAWEGSPYKVGQRVRGAEHQSPRRSRPVSVITVGRTFPNAVNAAITGTLKPVLTPNGGGEIIAEVQDANGYYIGDELLATYDPVNRTIGTYELLSSPDMTAAQALAYAYAVGGSEFQQEVMNALPGDELRVADSMYLVIKEDMETNGPVFVGGTISNSQRCPDCGRFVGQAAHVCPNAGGKASPAQTTTASATPVADSQAATPPTLYTMARDWTDSLVEQGVVDNEETAQLINEAIYNTVVSVKAGSISPTVASARLRNTLKTFALPDDVIEMAQYAVDDMAHDVLPLPYTKPEEREPVSDDNDNELEPEPEPEKKQSAPTTPPTAPNIPVKTKAKDVRPGGREVMPDSELTPQELIAKDVYLPAPDPWLADVPNSMGGQLDNPLNESVPHIDDLYVLDEGTEKILASISASLQLSQSEDIPPGKSPVLRSFGLYGAAGTGKNTLARQLAASIRTVEADGSIRQGVHYQETTVTPEMTPEDIIGSATLEATPEGGTQSRVSLGPIGQAAAMGGVIAVNEIARNAKLASSFQSMIEDGIIEIHSPEAGTVRLPVHPSTVFIFTWNPGYEGDADRPGKAALSRMGTYRMETPKEEDVMYQASVFLEKFGFQVDSIPAPSGVSLRKSYKIPPPRTRRVSRQDLEKATHFVTDLQNLTTPTSTSMAQVGSMSTTPTTPGRREYNRFLLLGKTVGWHEAVKIFQVCCDQGEEFQQQWDLVMERFRHYFGYN